MRSLYLKLPATSANLGPGFDALALALTFYLEIEAAEAAEFSIHASGRNTDLCAALEDNLLLDTYRQTMSANGVASKPLALHVKNEIPLGMGCGSSAATRLAGVALASHFGELHWSRERILTEASLLEGHPDNTAACWLGGLAVASWKGKEVQAISIEPEVRWKALVVMPAKPLATTASRGVLPSSYSRADAVANVQRVALLTAAFAAGRGDLLATATEDRMHQPYREQVCPLLPKLLPLAGTPGVWSVTLSGAGPSVLLLLGSQASVEQGSRRVREAIGDLDEVELIDCGIETAPADCR